MGEESLALVHSSSDREVEQAIVALKKGAHLLKYGRRGKPKLCPFRLSADEKFLIWYSGREEKQLRLSSMTNIVHGQRNKQCRPERESQCISLVYANGERSLDLICKDKVQAKSWFLGLSAAISQNYSEGTMGALKKQREAQSCINSPVGFMRRKHILGLSEDKSRKSQVHSLTGSPPPSFSASCISDGQSSLSGSFYSESSLSNTITNTLTQSPLVVQKDDINSRPVCVRSKVLIPSTTRFHDPSKSEMHILRDILIWGEGADGGCFRGEETQLNALLPRILESTTMLDVRMVSIGKKHAALITNQGEVYCWGEGKRGRLGHKHDMDTPCPKIVDSLVGVYANSINCGEYQTCAITPSGELYTWGDNYTSELPGADNKSSHWLPHRLSGSLEGISISNVSCGEWHTAIVSTFGQLFTYGDGTFGVLGHGDLRSFSHPKEVEFLKGLRVKAVACGPWHTAAIVETMVDCLKSDNLCGKLFTWGDSDKGRLGHSDQERKVLPTCIEELQGYDFVQVSCGSTLTVGLTGTGKVYTIGSAMHGQLGNSQARDKSIVAVQGRIVSESVVEISSGSYHVAVLTSKGNVYTWGKGENGQLGLGDTKDRNSPTLIETLRDRKVEKITCGSNSTAAICLHKSVSSADQSTCRGCGNAFGFTRKKHSCYNCGNLFCHACSSKRSANASLAPHENKPFRVCNECFNKLQSIAYTGVLSKFETNSPRPFLMTQKGYSDDKEGMADPGSRRSRTSSIRNSSDEGGRWSERKNINSQVEKPQPLDISLMVIELPRWGQVSCPELFSGDDMLSRLSSGYQSSSVSSNCLVDGPLELKSTSFAPSDVQKNLYQSERFLSEEILKLKTQADNLEKQCQSREEKIHEYQQKTEEAWSLAKEEAAKFKASKELIQSLTSKISAMLENFSGRQHAEDQALPDTRMHSIFPVSHLLCEIDQLEDRINENLSRSPIVSSNKIRSLGNGNLHAGITSTNESNIRNVDSGQTEIKSLKFEWVEQYQPGVYIAFVMLPNGKTDVKRVRFSRKKFTEGEAKRWWDENQHTICRNFGIEGYSSLKRD